MKRGASYYAGGARVLLHGVPIRLARKPSAHNLAWSREHERYRESDTREPYLRAKDAMRAIEIYADVLEISLVQARARIAAQRNHLIANPLVNLSLEYDL